MSLLESRDQCNNYQRDQYDVIIIKSEFKQEMTQFEGHPVKPFGQRKVEHCWDFHSCFALKAWGGGGGGGGGRGGGRVCGRETRTKEGSEWMKGEGGGLRALILFAYSFADLSFFFFFL